jgi:hypothetical protein
MSLQNGQNTCPLRNNDTKNGGVKQFLQNLKRSKNKKDTWETKRQTNFEHPVTPVTKEKLTISPFSPSLDPNAIKLL